MCGVCGTVHADPARRVDEHALHAMAGAIAHRGPDDAGTFVGPGVGLASRRLAIIDLSPRGHMPMASDDGRYHIVYNGEVYNAAALRETLRARGHAFHSATDTEVVLRLFVDEGASMLSRLNGMFAIAIWDARERRLFLARDRLGVKPLFYATSGGSLHFASEVKALVAGGTAPVFEPSTWPELLCFRYVAGERTPYAGVRRLLPGHVLEWHDGDVRIRRWWHLAARAQETAVAMASDPRRWFAETFDDAVDVRRISDVPLGVLLSGGLDSSSVAAALATRVGPGAASFTVRFREARFDEGPLARQVVERWRLDPHELVIDEREVLARLVHATWLNDEPLAHGNEPHLEAIAHAAKPLVTVLLSGEGADETLGGYVRYRPLQFPRLLGTARLAAHAIGTALPLPARLRKLARLLRVRTRDAAVLYNACELLPTDLRGMGVDDPPELGHRGRVLDEARAAYPGELVRQAMYLDQHTFLPSLLDRNDRMTMGASIECRVPFLDYRLVEGLAALPTARLLDPWRSKRLLTDALGHRLPAAVRRGRKWGFGVPWSEHLRRIPDLRDVVAALPESAPVADGPFDRGVVRGVVHRFLAGDRTLDSLVRQLLMVDVWHRTCIAGARRPPAGAPVVPVS